MNTHPSRQGRARRYELPVPAGVASPVVARALAAFDELSERHFDLIADLPATALDLLPDGAPSTIAMITGHLAQAEAFWISRLIGQSPPQELAKSLQTARNSRPSPLDAAGLVRLCRRVRDEFTIPALSAVKDGDACVQDGDRTLTPGGVLMHLVWHWTYHSGQTGLLRMQAGCDYDWALHPRFVGFTTG